MYTLQLGWIRGTWQPWCRHFHEIIHSIIDSISHSFQLDFLLKDCLVYQPVAHGIIWYRRELIAITTIQRTRIQFLPFRPGSFHYPMQSILENIYYYYIFLLHSYNKQLAIWNPRQENLILMLCGGSTPTRLILKSTLPLIIPCSSARSLWCTWTISKGSLGSRIKANSCKRRVISLKAAVVGSVGMFIMFWFLFSLWFWLKMASFINQF